MAFLCRSIQNSQNVYKSFRCIASSRYPVAANVRIQYQLYHEKSQDTRAAPRYGPIEAMTLKHVLRVIKNKVVTRHRITDLDFNFILKTIDDIQKPDSLSLTEYGLLIRCCGSVYASERPEKRMQYLQKIWNGIIDAHIPLNIGLFNLLLEVYHENKFPFCPQRVLADLKAMKVGPDSHTFVLMIRQYCSDGDIDNALATLNEMMKHGLAADHRVYNALVLGYMSIGDKSKAEDIIASMRKGGLDPDDSTYTTLMCAYAKKGQLDDIQATIRECQQNGIELNENSLCDIVYELTTNGFVELVDPLLSLLTELESNPYGRIRLILQLINQNHRAVAFKILNTFPIRSLSNGERADSGHFFLKQIVRNNCPYDEMMLYAKQLEKSGQHSDPYLELLHSQLLNGQKDNALRLLHDMKSRFITIEELYFWPLFCCQTTNEDVIDLLRVMKHEFQVEPTINTLILYAIPKLKDLHFNEMFKVLTDLGIPTSRVTASLARNAVDRNDLKLAAQITNTYRTFLNPYVFRTGLKIALNATNDIENYLIIIRNMYDQYRSGSVTFNKSDFLGKMIYDALSELELNARLQRASLLLSGCVREGLSISEKEGRRIRESFGTHLTGNVDDALKKLIRNSQTSSNLKLSSRHEVESIKKYAESKGQDLMGLNRVLLRKYMNADDIESYDALLTTLEEPQSVGKLEDNAYLGLIAMYANNGDANKVLESYERAKNQLPAFRISDSDIVPIISSLLNHGALKVANQLLETNRSKVGMDKTYSHIEFCKLLYRLADSGKVEETVELFYALQKNNYIKMTNMLAGPLIKVHLVNKDIAGAVEAFDRICTVHNLVPYLNELQCTLILANDTTNLNRILSLSSEVQSHWNALMSLSVSYIECGRAEDAIKVLRKIGFRESMGAKATKRFSEDAKRFFDNGQHVALSVLFEVTRGIIGIERTVIFQYLIMSYCKDEAPVRAMDLWMKRQEENVVPNRETTLNLKLYLKSKNIDISVVGVEPNTTTTLHGNSAIK